MRVGLSLGSNVGDRLANLQAAGRHLLELPGISGPSLASRLYETEPVGPGAGEAPFLNAVAELEYTGHPVALLDALQRIENRLGRPSKRPRNAPRTIDLDLLYAGNLTLANDEIVIPHPRLHLRRFVLAPLCELRPHLLLPGQERTVSQLLAALPPGDAVAHFPGDLFV